MKNISSFYGGAASTNDMKFKKFCIEQEKNLDTFFIFPLLKQVTIFFILKIMSIKYLYKYIFNYIIAIAHIIKLVPYYFYFILTKKCKFKTSKIFSYKDKCFSYQKYLFTAQR